MLLDKLDGGIAEADVVMNEITSIKGAVPTDSAAQSTCMPLHIFRGSAAGVHLALWMSGGTGLSSACYKLHDTAAKCISSFVMIAQSLGLLT